MIQHPVYVTTTMCNNELPQLYNLKENLAPESAKFCRAMQFIKNVCDDLDWVLIEHLSNRLQESIPFWQHPCTPEQHSSTFPLSIEDVEIR